MTIRQTILLASIALIFILSGCDTRILPTLPLGKETQQGTAEPVISTNLEQEINLPQAYVDFRVTAPDDTPTDDDLYLTVLDEVSGLYLNSTSYPMTLDLSNGIYSTRLLFPVGSVVKYRYERQGDEIRVAEHTSDGQPVRYRMLHVNGPSSVDDIISRWTDTEFSNLNGRIMGSAIDAETGFPIPNLLVTAGGSQTFTQSNGSFLIEGLPVGVHNLVLYSVDGAYKTFQQGAEIAAESTTPAQVSMQPAQQVKISFIVTPPGNTPPLVPLRFAGNLYQLGNTFGTLSGGVSTIANRMPIMTALPDGRYQIDLVLPAEADIRYKYTLGDGFWNAERTGAGELLLRQLIVPAQDTVYEETITTWQTNPEASLTFDITVPENTPAGDFVSIQFNPLFGWTEPMPMWSLGGNRWAYVLYSPLNLPGNLSYRYCRNDQCGMADDAATPGKYGQGRLVNLDQLPQQIKESVDAWVGLDQPVGAEFIVDPQAISRSVDFFRGVELVPDYHPSWQPLVPVLVEGVYDMNSNWLVYDPTWSVTRANPPVFEVIAGKDALWPDLVDTIQQAHARELKIAVQPILSFSTTPLHECSSEPCPTTMDFWWQEGQRDYSWWVVWFDHYRDFLLNYADLATLTGSEALIIGGSSIEPALPQGVLWDGQPSNVPADAENRWRNIIAEIRQHFQGEIIWSIQYQEGQVIPPFMDAVDKIYIDWQILAPSSTDIEMGITTPTTYIDTVLDGFVNEVFTMTGKPVMIALYKTSDISLDEQMNWYDQVLFAINQRDWISGFVSQSYYPPAALQDQSASIHGKPAQYLLQKWFLGFNQAEP